MALLTMFSYNKFDYLRTGELFYSKKCFYSCCTYKLKIILLEYFYVYTTYFFYFVPFPYNIKIVLHDIINRSFSNISFSL